MNKLAVSWLLSLCLILTFNIQASDEVEEELPLQIQLQNKVRFITLNTPEHEIYMDRKWIKGGLKLSKIDLSVTPSLSIKDLQYPNSVEYIVTDTQFMVEEKKVKFLDSAPFLGKIEALQPKGNSRQYNHLCLTLYVTYLKNDIIKTAESPLYAKWVGGDAVLGDDGLLTRSSTAKFYTKSEKSPHEKWAYFMSGGPCYHKRALNDNDVFPISPTSCYKSDFTPVCKKFFNVESAEASKVDCTIGSVCGHTEPNALFYIFKNKEKLFTPLIAKAGGIGLVKSIGVRFFSYYEPCLSCLSVLRQNKSIQLQANEDLKLDFIFYFLVPYQTNRHVLKIMDHTPRLRFTNLYNNGQILAGFLNNTGEIVFYEEEGNTIGKGNVLNFISISQTITLTSDPKKIFLVQPPLGEEEELDGGKKFKIYISE